MKHTFSGCTSLASLDLSSLNTVSLTNMAGTFSETNSLATLTLGGKFTTKNVTTMENLFLGVDATSTQSSTATEIIGMRDSFKTENVGVFSKAFSHHKFTSLDLNGFNTINVGGNKGFTGMFNDVQFQSNTELDVTSFGTGNNATYLISMFGNMVNVDSIKFGEGFNTESAKNFAGMFMNFNGTILDLRYFNNSSATNYANMFNGCSNLTTVYVDPSK